MKIKFFPLFSKNESIIKKPNFLYLTYLTYKKHKEDIFYTCFIP